MSPVLLMIAGPNGSGKTTITGRLRADHWSDGVEYLNPDDIAQEKFGGWDKPEAFQSAAKWTEKRREELLAAHQGIAFETVFSHPDKVNFLERARDQQYFIRVFFIGTESPTINAARVTARVMSGGHSVPIEKIISRYKKSLAQLIDAICLSDRVYLYDNSVDNQEARLCARTVDGRLRKTYGKLPQWIDAAIGGLEKHLDFEDLP